MQQIKGWLQSFLSLLIISVACIRVTPHLTDSSGWHESTSWCQSCLWWFFSANLSVSLPTFSAIWPRNDVCLSANMHRSIICMSHKARWKSVSNQFSPLSDSGSAILLAAGCFCSTIADFSAVPTERPEEDGSLSPQNTGFAINISQHLRTNHIVLSFLRSLRRYSLFLFFFFYCKRVWWPRSVHQMVYTDLVYSDGKMAPFHSSFTWKEPQWPTFESAMTDHNLCKQ